jgi:hypothetical protein
MGLFSSENGPGALGLNRTDRARKARPPRPLRASHGRRGWSRSSPGVEGPNRPYAHGFASQSRWRTRCPARPAHRRRRASPRPTQFGPTWRSGCVDRAPWAPSAMSNQPVAGSTRRRPEAALQASRRRTSTASVAQAMTRKRLAHWIGPGRHSATATADPGSRIGPEVGDLGVGEAINGCVDVCSDRGHDRTHRPRCDAQQLGHR